MENDQRVETGTTPPVRWQSKFLTHAMTLATVPNDAQSLLRCTGIARMSDLSLLEESDWNFIADEWAKTKSRNLLWHRRLKTIAGVFGRHGSGGNALSRPFTSYKNIEEICKIDKVEAKPKYLVSDGLWDDPKKPQQWLQQLPKKPKPQASLNELVTRMLLKRFDIGFIPPSTRSNRLQRGGQGIKDFSQLPTIPQLYVKGEFFGGCDIITEMTLSGELDMLFEENGVAYDKDAADKIREVNA